MSAHLTIVWSEHTLTATVTHSEPYAYSHTTLTILVLECVHCFLSSLVMAVTTPTHSVLAQGLCYAEQWQGVCHCLAVVTTAFLPQIQKPMELARAVGG